LHSFGTMKLIYDHRNGKRKDMPIRILLADDHFMFRETLREALRHKADAYTIVGEAADGAEILALLTRYQPDLLLLDYKMPGLGRLSTFGQEVARCSPATRTLLVSGYAEESIALEAAVGGMRGYIVKGAPLAELFSAIATIQAGGVWVDPRLPPPAFHAFLHQGANGMVGALSRRELAILSLVVRGMKNREIGVRLHISEKTVKNHLTHVFAKLGVTSRQQAVLSFVTEKTEEPQRKAM